MVVLRISNICVTDRPTDRSTDEQMWPLINAREAHMHLKKVTVAKNGEIQLRVSTNLRSFS